MQRIVRNSMSTEGSNTALSPSPSEYPREPMLALPLMSRPPAPRHRQDPGVPRPFVIVGILGDPRTAGFQAARTRAGLPPADVLDYRELIVDVQSAAARIPQGARVRIDSPGRDPQVLSGLLKLGVAP